MRREPKPAAVSGRVGAHPAPDGGATPARAPHQGEGVLEDRVTVTALDTMVRRLMKARVVKFGVIGVFSSLAYVLTMAAFVDGLHVSVLMGAVVAFFVGAIVSYVGNTLWTFSAPLHGVTLVRFLIVTGLGFLINCALAYGLERMALHHLLISLIILTIVPVFNYLGHAWWTYRHVGRPAS